MKFCFRLFIFIFSVATGKAVVAQEGGPPMLTDDARVTDYREWEINISLNPSLTNRFELAAPYIDLNYGIAPDLQLKAEAPYLFSVESGRISGGVGDIAVGIKFRFLHEEKHFISAATFPQVFVSGDKGLLLPLFIEKTIGRFLIGNGFGYFAGRDQANNFQYGSLAGYRVHDRLDFMAEYFLQRNYHMLPGRNEFINLGFRHIINQHFTIMASAGTQISAAENVPKELLIGWIGLRSEF